MKAKMLLFGFEELPTILAVAKAGTEFGAEVVPVARQDYQQTLAVLAGEEDAVGTPRPYLGGPLGGRMLVLCGLEGVLEGLLPALRSAGVDNDCMKAVLTEHNRRWTPIQLFRELQQEHQALQGW